MDDPGQALHEGRLAGAVRADQTQDLAGLDVERDAFERLLHLPLAAEKRTDGALQARLFFVENEAFSEVFDLDHRRNGMDIMIDKMCQINYTCPPWTANRASTPSQSSS